jgi:hypothetical protein
MNDGMQKSVRVFVIASICAGDGGGIFESRIYVCNSCPFR